MPNNLINICEQLNKKIHSSNTGHSRGQITWKHKRDKMVKFGDSRWIFQRSCANLMIVNNQFHGAEERMDLMLRLDSFDVYYVNALKFGGMHMWLFAIMHLLLHI